MSVIPAMEECKSRFSITDYPAALPGKCVVCGGIGGDGRKFIDFGFEQDFYGVIYFCTLCFTECLNVMGWASPDQVKEVESHMLLQEQRLSELEAENVRLRGALSQLDFLGVAGITAVLSDDSHETSSGSSRDSVEIDIGSVESVDGGGSSDIQTTLADAEFQSTDLANVDEFL